MNLLFYKILLTVAIGALKYFRRQRKLMTPEQRAELDAATKESFDHAGTYGE